MTPLTLFAIVAALAASVTTGTVTPPAPGTPFPAPAAHSFKEISIRRLRIDPAPYVGTIFDEEFVFTRIWWSHDRQRPGQPSLDLPTHFTARSVASPAYVVRIEFPPAADPLFEPMRDGTNVRLRVRFLRLHPANRSPVFAFEKQLSRAGPATDLDYLRR